jgi:CRP-like cAMP-binding protein
MPHKNNLLLASLAPADLEMLLPHLRVVHTKHGDVVAQTREKIERVYFPHGGILSYVVELKEGDMIETGMIGRDGIMGAGPALDDRMNLNKVIAQVPGAASVMDVERLRDIAKNSEPFRSLLARHEMLLHAQAQQSAACNAAHNVEARMCRWVVRMHDLVGKDLPLTQEFLAQMLGVRRTSVSLVAGTLQAAGFIKYRRGHIQILDIDALKESACECYETVAEQYELMINGRQISNR